MPLAARLGVAIGVETHDAFSASSAVAELLALVYRTGCPRTWWARSGTAIIRTGWARRPPRCTPTWVLACCSPRSRTPAARRGGDWRLVLLGAGEVPVREMLGLLTAGGYPHWISVEWEKRWHPEIEDPEVALPQHLDLLTTWLESEP